MGRANKEVGRQERERMRRRICGGRAGMVVRRLRRAVWRSRRVSRAARMPSGVPKGEPARMMWEEVGVVEGGKR